MIALYWLILDLYAGRAIATHKQEKLLTQNSHETKLVVVPQATIVP